MKTILRCISCGKTLRDLNPEDGLGLVDRWHCCCGGSLYRFPVLPSKYLKPGPNELVGAIAGVIIGGILFGLPYGALLGMILGVMIAAVLAPVIK